MNIIQQIRKTDDNLTNPTILGHQLRHKTIN
jgi:hypothetical protein